jgi:hypothetical protein
MKKIASCTLFVCMFCMAAYSNAGVYSMKLGTCMAENTTGKDRKNLARWVITATTVHPELKSILTVSEQSIDLANREVAALLTKLLAESCVDEVKMASKNEGSNGMHAAFETLGKLAMQEIMSNQDVAISLTRFEKYLDKAKLDRALKAQ